MFYNLLFRLNISWTSFHVILSKEYVISQYMNIIIHVTNSICMYFPYVLSIFQPFAIMNNAAIKTLYIYLFILE